MKVEWVRHRGSNVYNNSSTAAHNIQQHFPWVYLCTYNIVSLLWASHSCFTTIHLLSHFPFLSLCSVLCWVVLCFLPSHPVAHSLLFCLFLCFSVSASPLFCHFLFVSVQSVFICFLFTFCFYLSVCLLLSMSIFRQQLHTHGHTHTQRSVLRHMWERWSPRVPPAGTVLRFISNAQSTSNSLCLLSKSQMNKEKNLVTLLSKDHSWITRLLMCVA